MPASVPALAMADRWSGSRRAAYLAYQASFWANGILTAQVPVRYGADSLLATHAMRLARESLELDPANVEALQTVAALMSAVPAFQDPRAEAAIRERIVTLRPGDLNELVPWLRLVAALSASPASRDPGLIERAEAARRRFVGLLDLCLVLWPDPGLARLRQQWAAAPGAPAP